MEKSSVLAILGSVEKSVWADLDFSSCVCRNFLQAGLLVR